MTITANASDATSGIATVETTVDGGAWTAGNALTLSDGTHSYQFRVTDNAGNVTETGALEIVIDAAPPVIDLPETWNLGETAPYEVRDNSGIAEVRVVIEDEDERFPKVVWDENPSGTKFNSEIAWDGLWKDKSKVVPGEYPACVKASDTAGNESMKCGMIVVEAKLLGITLPPMMKPESKAPAAQDPQPDPLSQKGDGTGPILPLIFGGNKTAPQSAPSAPQPATQFSAPSTKSAVPPLTPQQQGNILWGAAAAASVGAWTAETQRKKKEKEEAARAARAAETAERSKAYSQIAKAYSGAKAAFKAAVADAQARGMSKQEADRLTAQVNTTGTIGKSLTTVQERVKQLDERNEQKELEDIRKEAARQRAEAQRKAKEEHDAYIRWLQTGKNPPPGLEDVSPQERLDMYKETPEYQARNADWASDPGYQDFRAGERAGGDRDKVNAYLAQQPATPTPNFFQSLFSSKTPTPNVNATQTSAVQTIVAQILGTMTAQAPTTTLTPTKTSTPFPTFIPTAQPTFLPLPGGMEAYSSYWYGKSFFDMLADPNQPGWWTNYQGQPFSEKTYLGIVYNYEFATLWGNPANNVPPDLVARDYITEAFARRYWQSQLNYGPNGKFWYIGGRQAAINQVLNGKITINETDYNMSASILEADKILTIPDWKNGIDWGSPYDWGNPKYSPETISRIQAYIPNFWKAYINGNVGPADNQILYISPGGELIIVTQGQNATLCNNQSCIWPGP